MIGCSNSLKRSAAVAVAIAVAATPTLAADWLRWGGPAGDFTVESTGLAETWPEAGPRTIWKRELGDGYSSIVAQGDRLFTMYHEGDHEVIVAMDAGTGKTVWEHRYERTIWPDMTEQFGLGPNATPLIVGDRIVTIGISGMLHCLDTATGKVRWKHDLPAEFGRRERVEEYGYSNSPLEYGGNILVHVGGDDVAIVAFRPKDGSIAWKSEAGGVSYAQPSIFRIGGKDQFLYFSPEGVNALDPKNGKTLWRSEIPVDNGNHLTPAVLLNDDHIWVSSQFLAAGGRLIKIEKKKGAWSAEQLLYERKLRTSHWTLIPIGGYVYGSNGGNDVSFLAAFDWKTGKFAWRERGFHKAQSLYADGKLLFLDENGVLAITKVSPEGVEVLAKAQVTESASWTLPTLVGTTLYVRDRHHVMALDLGR